MIYMYIVSIILIFLAYREGLRTGLGIRENKLVAVTPKKIKKEKKEFQEKVEAEQEIKKAVEKITDDMKEALDISRLYGDINE